MSNYNFLNKVFILSIAILLFCGINVLGKIGIHVEFVDAPSWQKILPSVYIVCPLFFYTLHVNRGLVYNREERNLIILFFLMSISLFIKGNSGFIGILNCNFFPIFICYISSFIFRKCPYYKGKFLNLILVFFVVECCLSILERILNVDFFPFLGTGDGIIGYASEVNEGFRSTALQNHPLQNALCVSVVMAYVLCSKMKVNKKLALFFLGYLAILCFNTRSSIVLWGVFFLIYLVFNLKKYKGNSRVSLILVAIGGAFAMVYLILNYGLADRLIKNGLLDESSAGQRLQLLDVFKYISWNDLLFGISSFQQQRALDFVNVGIVENPWVVIAFSHGIIVLGVMIYLYYKLFKRLFRMYNFFDTIFICFTFLIIASTNNSLVTPGAYLPLFILCSYIFSPKLK